jgi:ribonuclease BN (tRNA processing enzyme)
VRIRILGCSGGELPRHRTTCFLVDGRLAIDAGALTASLPLEELLAIDDILLPHAHLDHVKDVPLLADLLVGRRRRPVRVHASPGCARTLRDSLFNGRLWPDFTRIPDPRRPVLRILPFTPGKPFRIGRYAVRPVKVRHPVESVGFVVSDGRGAFAVSGDTGPTRGLWREVNAAKGLGALLVELSFPTALQRIADLSGHLTPRTLAGELAKLDRNGYPVYLYHLKPAYAADIEREVAALGIPGVRVLAAGDELRV